MTYRTSTIAQIKWQNYTKQIFEHPRENFIEKCM